MAKTLYPRGEWPGEKQFCWGSIQLYCLGSVFPPQNFEIYRKPIEPIAFEWLYLLISISRNVFSLWVDPLKLINGF